MKNILIVLLIVLISICSFVPREQFLTKNLSGNVKMSETTILNPSNSNIVNKYNVIISKAPLYPTRWFKLLDIERRTDKTPPSDFNPIFSIQLDVFPNTDSRKVFTTASQTFTAGAELNGDKSKIQIFKKNFSTGTPFDFMVIEPDLGTKNASLWVHSSNENVDNILARLIINERVDQKDYLRIKLYQNGKNSFSKPLSITNYQFPSGDWDENWENKEDENGVKPTKEVKRQVSRTYVDIVLYKKVLKLNEKIGVVRTNVATSRKMINDTKDSIDVLENEYEETDQSIKTSERNKVYLEQNIQTLKNNLPYCRDSDFNQNENSRDESQKCCPTGWNRFPDQTGELLPDCKTVNYPYDKIPNSELTRSGTCLSAGGTVKSSDIGEWHCERFPSKQLSFVTNTKSNHQNLCGTPRASTTLEYTGTVCSDDNSIRWDDVRALNKSDDNIPLDKKACRWNRSMEQTALEAENTKSSELLGSCGIAPTIKTALEPRLPMTLDAYNTVRNTNKAQHPKIPSIRAQQSVNCIRCKACKNRKKNYCIEGDSDLLNRCLTNVPSRCTKSINEKSEEECPACSPEIL